MTTREFGYYWVKIQNVQEWTIAEYLDMGKGRWMLFGYHGPVYEQDFTQIGPRILPPA